jgi:hypothetical protein
LWTGYGLVIDPFPTEPTEGRTRVKAKLLTVIQELKGTLFEDLIYKRSPQGRIMISKVRPGPKAARMAIQWGIR